MVRRAGPGSGATVLHADLDAFYASVEQLLRPELRGKPIAVGGGVVLAASYEAKAFGVAGGMPGWRARRLCPALEVVGGHFEEYQRLGDAVVAVLEDFTPVVERISIDEAFLDVAGSTHLFGAPAVIAAKIRRRVRDEIGLPISVGVASTKHLAKVASQVAKPDGLVVVPAGREREFLAPLPVGLVWGVGPVTRAKLAAKGITTVGQLGALSPDTLRAVLGRAAGTKLAALAGNRDAREVRPPRRAGSVGAQSALGRVAATEPLLRETLGYLADRVGRRLRAATRVGRTLTVRVRFPGMSVATRSATLPRPTASTRELTEHAVRLARRALADHPEHREVTLLGLSVSNLADDGALQLELPFREIRDHRPDRPTGAAARRAVDGALDAARERFGRSAVGYGRVQLAERTGVPDAFRELAEH